MGAIRAPTTILTILGALGYNTQMNLKEEFYNKICDLLEVNRNYKEPLFSCRTRWNNQHSIGNGRFEKHGVVRYFNDKAIHVHLHNPKISGMFTSPELACKAIRDAKTPH